MSSSIEELQTYTLLLVPLFVCALALCAIFAFIETSITAIRLFTIDELEKTVGSYHTFFAALRHDNHRVLTTILVANSCTHMVATMLSAQLSVRFFAPLPGPLSVLLGVLFTTSTMLLCGEIIPKNMAQTVGAQHIRSTLWISNAAYHLLYPLVSMLTRFSHHVVSRYTPAEQMNFDPKSDISVAEVQFLIHHIHTQGKLSTEQAQRIQLILSDGTIPHTRSHHRPPSKSTQREF